MPCLSDPRGLTIWTALFAAVQLANAYAADSGPLQLESKIPLGDVAGRIDHLAVDLDRQRLFVAELGNNSVGVVDLKKSQVAARIGGLEEPQGVAYLASAGTLYVASGDGSLRLFQGPDLKETGRIQLGEDADNIRIDSDANQLFVGYGDGALAIIDAAANRKSGDVPLDGHPESFRLESGGSRIFVNVPDAHMIEVGDRQRREVIARWPTGQASENYPMALDEASGRLLVAFRKPATLTAFSMQDGSPVASTGACGDADDVFVDAKRRRIYVSCGEGYLDAFEAEDGSFRRIAHVPTAPGARTSLFVPELDRLFLAVRAHAEEQAAVWIYRPTP